MTQRRVVVGWGGEGHMLVGKHVHQMVGPAGGLEAAGGLKQGSQEDGCCVRAPGHGVGCSLNRAPSWGEQADVRAGVLPPEARECGRGRGDVA